MNTLRGAVFSEESKIAKKTRLRGELVISSSVEYSWAAICSLIFIAAISLFLIFGFFHRTEEVPGVLVASSGVIRVYPATSGTLDATYVMPGQMVQKGGLLATLSAGPASLGNEIDAEETILTRINLLEDQIELKKNSHALSVDILDKKKASLVKKLANSKLQLAQRRAIVESTAKILDDSRALEEKGHIRRAEYEGRKQSYASANLSLLELQNVVEQIVQDIGAIATEYEQNKNKTAIELNAINDQIEVNRELLGSLRQKKKHTIQAPVAGRITSIFQALGSGLQPTDPVLAILPDGGRLVVQLHIPSKAIAFIEVGQGVEIEFDAFPSDKYGTYTASIFEVEDSIILPSDNASPIDASDPYFRAFAEFEADDLISLGRLSQLRHGMNINATIFLGESSFVDWVFSKGRGQKAMR